MMLRNRKSKQSFSSSSAKSNKEGHNVPEDGDSATKSVQSENSLSLTDAYDKMKVKDRAQNGTSTIINNMTRRGVASSIVRDIDRNIPTLEQKSVKTNITERETDSFLSDDQGLDVDSRSKHMNNSINKDESRFKKIMTRVISGFFIFSLFLAIIQMGHIYICGLIFLVEILVVR